MYANHEHNAKRKTLSTFVLVTSMSERREAILVAKVLLLLCCFVEGDFEGIELPFRARYRVRSASGWRE